MSQGLFSIGGLASGLDTQNIISQLMQLERVPVKQMESRQAALREVEEAWSLITTKLSSIRTSIDGLAKPGSFAKFALATSSNTTAVGVTVTGKPEPSSIAFEVEKLATARRYASDDTFAGTTAAMGTRQLTITKGADSWSFDGATYDTLGEFVTAINDSTAPVKAEALRVSDTEYRLVITAESTGVANDFTVTPTNWGGATPFTSPQIAQDAELRIGDPDTGLLVTRGSNSITDLVDGVTIDLKTITTGLVTVSTTRDVDGAVKAVKKLVDDVNGLLNMAKGLSKYDPETKRRSALTGDGTLRRLTGDLLNAFSSTLAGITGDYSLPSSLGISLTKDGALTFDESKLRTALTDDWAGVTGAITRGANTTSLDARASYVSHTDATQTGTYRVRVTQAATQAQVTGSAYVAPGAGTSDTLTISQGGKTANIVIDDTHTTAALAVQEINDGLDAAGITALRAEESGGAIRLVDSRYGAVGTFNVTATGGGFGLTGAHAAFDVEATVDTMVDGVAVESVDVVGLGRSLIVTSGDANGLALNITASEADVAAAAGDLSLGTLELTQGLAGQIGAVLLPREGSTGELQVARDYVSGQIALFQERIERFEIRIAQREITLRRQFTALETAMQRLTSQGNWLSSQLAQMGGGRQ